MNTIEFNNWIEIAANINKQILSLPQDHDNKRFVFLMQEILKLIENVDTNIDDNSFHTRNSEILIEFMQFCIEYPDMRFMQALRAFVNWPCVLVGENSINPETLKVEFLNLRDTYYWEGIQPYK